MSRGVSHIMFYEGGGGGNNNDRSTLIAIVTRSKTKNRTLVLFCLAPKEGGVPTIKAYGAVGFYKHACHMCFRFPCSV